MSLLKRTSLLFAFLICIMMSVGIHAQTRVVCDETITDADGYKIRSVKADGRYLPVSLPSKGTPFTTTLRSEILNDVLDVIRKERNRESIVGATLYQIKGKAGTVLELNAITDCVQVIDEEACQTDVGQKKCVDITVHAKSLRFSPDNPAETVINAVSRSNSQTILSNVPKPLLIFNPQFGVDYDRTLGAVQNLEASTNLLDLGENLNGKPIKIKKNRLDVKVQLRKSLNKDFYNSDAQLSYSHFLPSSFFERVSASVGFTASSNPSGEAVLFKNSVIIGGNVTMKPNAGIINSVLLEGNYQRSNNRFIRAVNSMQSEHTMEDAFKFRALINGTIKQDVLRIGFWAEGGSPESLTGSYKRTAGLIGYAKDFGKENNTFGVEMLLGGGKVWGTIPDYARFYGGNNLKNFLFESNTSAQMSMFPGGPLIRSFGSGQAINNVAPTSANGSTSYWHFNFNMSIPIPAWSKPLIPNEELDIPGSSVTNIRMLIKRQAASGETILRKIYERQGVPNAAEKARKEFKSINSAITFLTDQANIYSVKPLFMFDVAKFNGGTSLNNKTRFGMGAGLQITVVIAKFEAGYIWTVNRLPGDNRGNFITRLYFQNLF